MALQRTDVCGSLRTDYCSVAGRARSVAAGVRLSGQGPSLAAGPWQELRCVRCEAEFPIWRRSRPPLQPWARFLEVAFGPGAALRARASRRCGPWPVVARLGPRACDIDDSAFRRGWRCFERSRFASDSSSCSTWRRALCSISPGGAELDTAALLHLASEGVGVERRAGSSPNVARRRVVAIHRLFLRSSRWHC